MGNFLGSTHLRTDDRQAVRDIAEDIAKELQTRLLIGPPRKGWVALYPENFGQDERVPKRIARRFPGEVLHLMVHDDDVFAYLFFRAGKLVDRYSSNLDYFEKLSARNRRLWQGQPEQLADLLPPGRTVQELRAILDPRRAQEALFAMELLEEFASVLGLTNAAAAYEYLTQGETDRVEGWDEFIDVPDQNAERARERQAEARNAEIGERLRAEGLLLVEQAGPPNSALPVWCPAPRHGGFLVCWGTSPATGRRPLEQMAPLWTAGSAAAGWVLEAPVSALAASRTGRYLAVGYAREGASVQLAEPDHMAPIAEIPHAGMVAWLGFTADERHLVSFTGWPRPEVVIASVPDGRRVSSWRPAVVGPADAPALHPSGFLLLADSQVRLLIAELFSGKSIGPFTMSPPSGPGADRLGLPTASASAETRLPVTEGDLRQALERVLGKGTPGGSGQVEDLLEQIKQRASQWQESQVLAFPVTAERLSALECSTDGRLLFCATSAGLRVYAWDEVLAASERLPAPRFAAEAEPVAPGNPRQPMSGQRYTYALAHDTAGNRLLFAGLEGKLRALDLVEGRTDVLLELPGRPPVVRLALAPNLATLACLCRPDMVEPQPKRSPPVLQIWNYRALRDRFGAGPSLRVAGPDE